MSYPAPASSATSPYCAQHEHTALHQHARWRRTFRAPGLAPTRPRGRDSDGCDGWGGWGLPPRRAATSCSSPGSPDRRRTSSPSSSRWPPSVGESRRWTCPGRAAPRRSGRAGSHTARTLADAVAAVAEWFAPGRPVHLVGHSMGGLVTREARPVRPGTAGLVDRHEQRPRLDPRARAHRPAPARGRPGQRPDRGRWAAKEQMDRAGGWDPPSQEVADFCARRFITNDPAALSDCAELLMTAPDLTDQVAAALDASMLPAAVVTGEIDDAWPPDVQEDMAERLRVRGTRCPGWATTPPPRTRSSRPPPSTTSSEALRRLAASGRQRSRARRSRRGVGRVRPRARRPSRACARFRPSAGRPRSHGRLLPAAPGEQPANAPEIPPIHRCGSIDIWVCTRHGLARDPPEHVDGPPGGPDRHRAVPVQGPALAAHRGRPAARLRARDQRSAPRVGPHRRARLRPRRLPATRGRGLIGGSRPEPRPADAEDEGGRGMEIIDKLSARWGWRARGHVKVVWLDLPMPTGAAPRK